MVAGYNVIKITHKKTAGQPGGNETHGTKNIIACGASHTKFSTNMEAKMYSQFELINHAKERQQIIIADAARQRLCCQALSQRKKSVNWLANLASVLIRVGERLQKTASQAKRAHHSAV
jgi:hypothetical protein